MTNPEELKALCQTCIEHGRPYDGPCPQCGAPAKAYRAATPEQAGEPIPMVLHCPKCRLQHIDEPVGEWDGKPWDNPPHRSHLCNGCGHIWRPADVATNGVRETKTRGKADSPAPTPLIGSEVGEIDIPTLASVIHDGRFDQGRNSSHWTPFEQECESGKIYCTRIANCVQLYLIAALSQSETRADVIRECAAVAKQWSWQGGGPGAHIAANILALIAPGAQGEGR